MRIAFIILFAGLFITGSSQVDLTICNKSTAIIDSVIIEVKKPIRFGPIDPGSSKTVFVSVDQANFHLIAPFHFSVFSPVLNTNRQWQKTGFIDTICFYDHGLEMYEKAPRQPDEFRLYIINYASIKKVDTIYAPNNAIKKIREATPRSFSVTLDHKQAELDKNVYLQLGQKLLTINLIDYKFNDWNEYSGTAYVYDDSILTAFRKNAKQYEFQIVFDIEDDLSWKEVEISSKHLQKTYVNDNGKSILAVFDHAEFIAQPEFEIRIGGKKHHLRLKKEDLSEEANFTLYTISKNKISCYNCSITN